MKVVIVIVSAWYQQETLTAATTLAVGNMLKLDRGFDPNLRPPAAQPPHARVLHRHCAAFLPGRLGKVLTALVLNHLIFTLFNLRASNSHPFRQ